MAFSPARLHAAGSNRSGISQNPFDALPHDFL